jgi:hypothetical protein
MRRVKKRKNENLCSQIERYIERENCHHAKILIIRNVPLSWLKNSSNARTNTKNKNEIERKELKKDTKMINSLCKKNLWSSPDFQCWSWLISEIQLKSRIMMLFMTNLELSSSKARTWDSIVFLEKNINPKRIILVTFCS